MRSSKIILALWLGASAWAQTLPQKPQVNLPAAAKPSAAQTPAPAHSTLPSLKTPAPAGKPEVAALPTAKVPSGKVPANPVVAPTSGTHAKSLANPAARTHAKSKNPAHLSSVVKAAVKDSKPATTEPKGRRDPFVSQVVDRLRNGAACTGSGRQCLVVGEISLHGVVRCPSGFIAVVMNGEHTYFLRVNDPLADGAVERITRDAIVLRERSSDALGRPFTREVTKKLVVPAV